MTRRGFGVLLAVIWAVVVGGLAAVLWAITP